ncbi:hypothetical protein ACFXAZ_34445 [Streptomyces sp. NPDC059477]|uniref:DUF7739 domain-containing protein n=1 Tax=Streptomyces sp. NPDC059477 TaxID=3346847 RepID=UPI00367920D8
MGWNISPGQFRRSYTTMHTLGQHLAHVLPAGDWQSIAHLFGTGSGNPFTISPAQAARAARILRTGADHRLMPLDWATTARELAATAEQAASTGRPWEWR